MSSVKYDMTGWTDFDRFDLVNAAKNFDNHQDYFDKLTEVLKKSPSYLNSYNPDVVIYGEEVRKDFLEEFEKVQNLLDLFGMSSPVKELLKNIEEAVVQKKPKALSDLLLQFHAEMELLNKSIVAARMPDNEVSPSPAQDEEKPVILAVDDNPEILAIIDGVLGNKYRIVALTDSSLALNTMELYSPVLFLLDIEMPIVNGYELAKQIRAQARFKTTPILFLTINGEREFVRNAKECGVNDYLLKPVNKNLLVDKIKGHLARTR